jgi:hypothetical protein
VWFTIVASLTEAAMAMEWTITIEGRNAISVIGLASCKISRAGTSGALVVQAPEKLPVSKRERPHSYS